MKSPKGTATLQIGDERYSLRLGFSEIADADEYLGRSWLQAVQEQPTNFHLIRVGFYFATRERSKDIRSIKAAGRVLEDAEFEEVGQALMDALNASGMLEEGEEEGEA